MTLANSKRSAVVLVMPTNTKERRETLEAAGRAAYAAGRMRAPGLDPALRGLLQGVPGSAQTPLLAAWLRGWDAANLAAPLAG